MFYLSLPTPSTCPIKPATKYPTLYQVLILTTWGQGDQRQECIRNAKRGAIACRLTLAILTRWSNIRSSRHVVPFRLFIQTIFHSQTRLGTCSNNEARATSHKRIHVQASAVVTSHSLSLHRVCVSRDTIHSTYSLPPGVHRWKPTQVHMYLLRCLRKCFTVRSLLLLVLLLFQLHLDTLQDAAQHTANRGSSPVAVEYGDHQGQGIEMKRAVLS
jgi:hypothetical protein